MGTRATYRFNATRTTLYVHWDGYPEGAAQKFKAAIECLNERGTLMERFLRTEHNAEWTSGHAAHGDTEYQYTVDENVPGGHIQLTVLERQSWNDDDDFKVTYQGTLKKWLEETLKEPIVDAGGRLMTVKMLIEKIAAKIEYLKTCKAKGWTGNGASAAKEAWGMSTWVPISGCSPEQMIEIQSMRQEILDLSKDFAELYDWARANRDQEDWNDQFYPGWREAS